MNDGSSDGSDKDGQTLAVLFADIDGSTKLYEVYGDETAHRLTAECLTVLDAKAGMAGGRVVKTSGDGVMCVFATPDEAFRAATLMRDAHKHGQVSIHAGFHFGPVIEDSGDFYGDTVNVAARVTDLAKAGEILVTEDTVVRLSPPFRSSTRWIDKAAMKGKRDPVAIYEVVTEDENATVISGPLLAAESDRLRLDLAYRGETFSLEEPMAEFVVGRQDSCDLTVDSSYASRRHATIQAVRGKVFLKDHSTNGTYVRSETGDVAYVKREMVQLVGRGGIFLGREPELAGDDEIRFNLP
ncbi:adenylate/guanylate cyclase domain-containing protein [Pelagibius sp.]|uniref:adenylate/guanylate cyclase domain-containing protein n=1 Tax=Pelagibius sp. TaxID=1931238 RepID=UPI003B50E20B